MFNDEANSQVSQFYQQAKNMFGEAMVHLPKILTPGLLLRS